MEGRQSASIESTNQSPTAAGNLFQAFSAKSFQGKQVRFRAAVREKGEGQAQLWMRIDRSSGEGFFDNMRDRPITNGDWAEYAVTGPVHGDAETILLGLLQVGPGTAWIDAGVFEVVGDIGTGDGPPRAVTELAVDMRRMEVKPPSCRPRESCLTSILLMSTCS